MKLKYLFENINLIKMFIGDIVTEKEKKDKNKRKKQKSGKRGSSNACA